MHAKKGQKLGIFSVLLVSKSKKERKKENHLICFTRLRFELSETYLFFTRLIVTCTTSIAR